MKFWILGTKEKRPAIEFRVYGTKPTYPFVSWISQLVKLYRIQNLRSVILIFNL